MRVLVCDDDLEVGPVMVQLFEFDGWDADFVTSGPACLDALRGGDLPDVLVLDQVMPGMLGTEVAQRLRDDGRTLPIVLCSAHLGPDVSADVERLDLTTISKIDLQALLRVCRRLTLGTQLAG